MNAAIGTKIIAFSVYFCSYGIPGWEDFHSADRIRDGFTFFRGQIH
jgi:hypothetical protein